MACYHGPFGTRAAKTAQLGASLTDTARMHEVVERCLTGTDLPGRIAELAEPPERLYLRGELPRGPMVAIVGTRQPTPEADWFAEELAVALARADIAVISGGAIGIDTAAHRGALAVGGCTVVAAAAGFERPYPAENAELFQRVLSAGGAYLSLRAGPFPAQQDGSFFARNACLVALAHAVVVVEAPTRSGARNAAKHARRLGRPLFVVPAAPWNPRGFGCLAELRLGARLLTSKKDLLRQLDALNLHSLPFSPPRPFRHALEQQSFEFTETSDPDADPDRVLKAVESGAVTADEIGLATGLRTARISELILTLRLEGVLVTDPSGRIRIGK